MSDHSSFSDDIDPEIAALLGSASESTGPSRDTPNFDALFEANQPSGGAQKGSKRNDEAKFIDFNVKTFPPIDVFEQKPPNAFFTDKEYYKKAMAGEGDVGSRVHSLLSDFLNAKDPESKTNARLRLTNAYWELVGNLAVQLGGRMPESKRVVLRYGALLPSLISPEQRTTIASIIWNNQFQEPLYFLDEWLEKVATGELTPLATDEPVKKQAQKAGSEAAQFAQKLDRAESQRGAQIGLIQNKLNEMTNLENIIMEHANTLKRKTPHRISKEISLGYESTHRHSLNQIADTVRSLNLLDREVTTYLKELEKLDQEVRTWKQRLDSTGGGDAMVDAKVVASEVISLRQIAKLTCGRQGNHFPILLKPYMPFRRQDIGSRENVLKTMSDVERLDPGLFIRRYKQVDTRIVPHVILVPSYGDYGVCWEPYEKGKGRNSRGRLAMPMYPKNLKLSVLYGLADFRWQLAKEIAGFHWMEEGITGLYYAWFDQHKLKGDVRMFFIRDYILWITKESEGAQKLDKEIRGIFWRNMPFPPEVREDLRNRGAIYNDLYKKDINRSMSDGY